MKHSVYSTDYSALNDETSPARILRALGVSYLGACDSSAKIAKGEKKRYRTYVLYLAPAKLSGFELCPFRSPECTSACLHRSGRNSMHRGAGLSQIDVSRIKKSRLWIQAPQAFARVLWHEIAREAKKAERDGFGFAVRLNGTSDIPPFTIRLDGKNVLEAFPRVQFYDYTKSPIRPFQSIGLPNYHVTLSYTGRNSDACETALYHGVNVAVVFSGGLPSTFLGRTVIDGDETDLRFLDRKGVIVGLRLKRTRTKVDLEQNPFIVATG